VRYLVIVMVVPLLLGGCNKHSYPVSEARQGNLDPILAIPFLPFAIYGLLTAKSRCIPGSSQACFEEWKELSDADFCKRYSPTNKLVAQYLAKQKIDCSKLGYSTSGKSKAASPSLTPVKTFRDCADCPEMVVIPSGSFRMGDLSGGGYSNEKPVRDVRIGYNIAVGKYEVTKDEWVAVMNLNMSRFKDGRNPVEGVSWYGARAFVRELSAKTGMKYRLLSESEWEYMARAGSRSKYPWGNEFDASKANNNNKKVPVGSYTGSNSFGVHDTVGNVWEWVEDCWHDNYSGAPIDGSAWTSGGDCSKRVLRGGFWNNDPGSLRSAYRDRATLRSNFYGFRIARTLSQ